MNEDFAGPETPARGIRCAFLEYRPQPTAPGRWAIARYRWTAPASDPAEAAEEEEVVLLETAGGGKVRPVWHDRFITRPDAVWRSITPEASALPHDGGVLIGIQFCVDGTGGCGPEFLRRGANGTWTAIRQAWFDQLPAKLQSGVRHGWRIDPRTLRGQVPYYLEGEPNCCPSHAIDVQLALRGDQLVLRRYAIVRNP